MEEWINLSKSKFDNYYKSFTGLTKEQERNFEIKKDHSHRVARVALHLAEKLELSESDKFLAFFIGMFHDIGRFKQLLDYNTFNDSKSVDHAACSAEVLENGDFFENLSERQVELALLAIKAHNKRDLSTGLNDEERLFSGLIRDADKLDILQVLTDYYSNSKTTPNHTLTWEMPKGKTVSDTVFKQIIAGKLVSKADVKSELDIKVMQMSWVYDMNFKSSFEMVMEKRFLERIFNSMSKSDLVIEIYRTVKVYAENKLISSNKAVLF